MYVISVIVFKYLSHVIIYNLVTMVTGAVTATKLRISFNTSSKLIFRYLNLSTRYKIMESSLSCSQLHPQV